MKTPIFARSLLAWAALLSLGLLRAQEAVTPTFTGTASVHDPSVIRDGATYYVFGSHMAAASSTDLMNWTQLTTSAAAPNSLIRNQTPLVEFAEALTYAGNATTFWAPDVIKLADGKFRFYYCACQGSSPLSALGLAAADAVTGPYANVALLLKSAGATPTVTPYNAYVMPNVVDPSVFYDKAGTLWMVYGSFSGGIFILRLDATTGQPVAGQGYGKKLLGGNHARIEGSYIIYAPETDYYYLFCTFGGLDAAGGYNVRVGRSRSPDGPYLDSAGNDLTNVAGSPSVLFDDASIAPYGVKLMGNWQFVHTSGDAGALSRGYVSPGGVSIVREPGTGKYIMVFHTRFVGRGEVHEVRTHQLFLNENGWFVAAPQRYAQETIRTADLGQIPGDYKWISHGRDITATVKMSSLITLGADHTISGAITGTWQASGDHNVSLALSGVIYRGVFVRVWDDDNQMWVQAFTALSDDGTSWWGCKVAKNAALAIATPPAAQSVNLGQAATFSVATTGSPAPTYQWRKNGVAIAGATSSAYTIASATAADAGDYSVVATNSVGSVTSASAALSVAARPPQETVANGDRSAQIVNLSTRGIVRSGEEALIAGFVISGPASKQVLITAWGYNLRRLFGMTGEIGRPQMTIYRRVDNQNFFYGYRTSWSLETAAVSAAIAQVGAQPLSSSVDPAHGDAATVMTLPPGVYSVVVEPAPASATTDGVGLIEIYDMTPADGSRLVNISSRGRIEAGDRQMIVGVVVGGSGQARLLIRGVGPTLRPLGVNNALKNPSLTLVLNQNGQQTPIATNDDWWNSAQADQAGSLAPVIGAFALVEGSRDAMILRRFAPGVYSTLITPSDTEAGVAMAEVYDAYVP